VADIVSLKGAILGLFALTFSNIEARIVVMDEFAPPRIAN
jgi:hypothetical protein